MVVSHSFIAVSRGIEDAVGDLECECCGATIMHQDAVDEDGAIACRCQSCEFDWQKYWRTYGDTEANFELSR
jgi:ribosome-binding protein aMBF1 (putative translation factor)